MHKKAPSIPHRLIPHQNASFFKPVTVEKLRYRDRSETDAFRRVCSCRHFLAPAPQAERPRAQLWPPAEAGK